MLSVGTVALVILFGLSACDSGTEQAQSENTNDTPEDSYDEISDLVEENEEYELLPEKSLSVDHEEWMGEPWEETEIVQYDGGEKKVTTTWRNVRKFYSALNHPDKFVLYNVNASVLWPGNLIQGNSISSGVLNPVPISGEKRNPMSIFISMVTGTPGEYSATIDKPNGSKVFQAMNDVVGQHYGSTPGQTTLEISKVYNMNHVMFNLNAGYSVPSTDISGALGINWEDEKERVMVKFTQQYYSMAYESPHSAEAVFAPSVNGDDLAPFTSPENPLCYIDSVTFGRLFVYVYESNDSTINLEASLNAAFNGMQEGNVTAEMAYERVARSSTVKAYALGGSAQEALQVATDFSSLSEYLLNGAQLSADSPGAPISYTIRYLKNANILRMNNSLEYYVDEAVAVGDPQAVPTKTSFSVYFDHMEAINNDDGFMGGGSEGEFGFKVFKFEDGIKKEVFDSGLIVEYGQGQFTADAMRAVNQAVPSQTIKNVSGNKIIIQAYGYEEDTYSDRWFSVEKNFVYSNGMNDDNSWILTSSDVRDDNNNMHFNADLGSGQFLEFLVNFSLTLDGVTLQ